MTNLSAYRIKWNVIKLTRPLTKRQTAFVQKIGFHVSHPTLIMRHNASDHTAVLKQEELIKLLKGIRNGISFIITDKQFGMSSNSFNGCVLIEHATLPHIIIGNNEYMTAIPITRKQIQESIKF